ncbi:MAG: hypothetical protein EU548_08225, partial [Promethearchaeota archaeon]
MKNIEFTPEEIYKKRKELGIDTSIRTLLEIAESSKDQSKRKLAIQYLRSFEKISDSLKEECFDALEHIIVSDKAIKLKCEAATSLGKLKIEMGLEPLKWLLDQSEMDYESRKTVLRAIHGCRFEKPEIKLFLTYIDSPYKTIKNYVKNTLLNLGPETAIDIFLDFLEQNISDVAKKELINLIGYEISGLNVSFDGNSFL